jgi:hypothetical protein
MQCSPLCFDNVYIGAMPVGVVTMTDVIGCVRDTVIEGADQAMSGAL